MGVMDNQVRYCSHTPPIRAKGTESITISVSASRPKLDHAYERNGILT